MGHIEKRIISWEAANTTFTRCYIFGNYGDNFANYKELVKIAKKDFPKLKDEDITVAVVRESSYMQNFIYIHFLVSNKTKRKDYTRWKNFDWN